MAWDSLLKKQIEPPLTLRESHISLMWFICSIGYIHTPVLLGILTSLLSMLILSRNWHAAAAAAAKSLQSCPTLCDPTDGTPPGTAIPGIIQARTPEWVAISFSNAWKWKVKVKFLSHVRLLATPWTAAYQASPSMGFFMQEYWSGVPLPSPLCYVK